MMRARIGALDYCAATSGLFGAPTPQGSSTMGDVSG
jgi:hypothetical protein